MKLLIKSIAWIVVLLPVAHQAAFALGQILTLQGKVTNPQGLPVTGALTKFRVQIVSADSSRCVLYDETQTVDLSISHGLFSINLNNGTGTLTAPTGTPSGYTLEQAVSNFSGFSVDSAYCDSGSGTVSYSPGATGNRKVRISFNDPGSMGSHWEIIPEMDLNPVAMAMEARTLGGFAAGSVLRVADGSVAGTATPLSSSNFTELLNLISGQSANYMSSSSASTEGARLPSYSSAPVSSTSGSIWFDNTGTTGAIKFRDKTGAIQTIPTAAGGGGTITAVNAINGLAGGGSSGSVNVGLAAISPTPAGTFGGSGTVPVIQVDIYGRITQASSQG